MAYENILYEKRDGVAFITLNRPKVLNALNRRTLEELDDCIRDFHADDSLRAAVLTGAGEKSFVAGADINELAVLSPVNGRDYGLFGQSVLDRIERGSKPVIAAINGFALGGGCELAMACHLRLASENAKFGQPEVKLGLIPGYGGTQRLSRLVGKGRALQHVLIGDPISAEEAYRIGLVNAVVPAAELLATAETWAKKIAANAPLAIRFAIEAVNHGLEMTLPEGLYLEATLFSLCATTEDMKEGTKAFLEKRPAKFVGK
ncbi:MAG TPA: enoyl-CoA hydratase-related protein [Candidatus Acidoferrales bacterium]|nr:enoyl-CoA hydratase-related protein [Candidatus Acidoferrales bacterium]